MTNQFGSILLVEDIPNVDELLEVTLRFKGYPVVTARNGEEALEKVAIEKPALVITDILMPKMDGYALVHQLRNNPQTSDIPVIFVSATYITPEDRNFALSLGGGCFIEKPIDAEDFLLTVGEILTMGLTGTPSPMPDETFYIGCRTLLESKLRHKNTQIARTERLLTTLSDEQKPAFEALLKQAIKDRDQIQVELDRLFKTTNGLKPQ
jgi:CheY-like chemotaxis protein